MEAEHAGLLEATLARDTRTATERLRAHYERTVEILLEDGRLKEATTTSSHSSR
ncbi:hypothetical protein FHX44_118210 [Pseudonocardia hierapolitana]|uniref:FCD domain-containing protein n=1 Tax=Pseudonocardia hierapolitana TaxID=1128676 RepID=A0A561T584_9PSEU|nr:hypothetical protein [Pseudonocardia hierapolitana]TWF82265.1 hypothetical protein FHX44_118210 [Pseudonocardia hierapolitana]